jgi:hypothetical protein
MALRKNVAAFIAAISWARQAIIKQVPFALRINQKGKGGVQRLVV